MQRKQSITIVIHNQETAEVTENKCCEWWKNYLHTDKEGGWIENMNCGKWLHEFCSPYNDKCVECGRNLLLEENSKLQKRIYNIWLIATEFEFIWLRCFVLMIYFLF
jgi:hypothetical protein